MSETIGQMAKLELRQATDGRLYWMDDEAGQIAEEDALKSLGVDSEMRQEPVQAIWHNKEHDIPVTIVGMHGRLNNEDYLMAQETNAGIPRSELEFVNPELPVNKDEYIQRLEAQNRLLLSKNETLIADNERLSTDIASLKSDMAELQREFREFKGEAEPEEILADPRAEEPVEAESIRPEEAKDEKIFPGSVVDVEWPDEERGWGLTAASGVWRGPDGQEYITFIDGDKPRWAPVEKVSVHEDEWEAEPAVTRPLQTATPRGGFVTENRPLTWRERMGDLFYLRGPVTYFQTRRPVGGGPETEEEYEVIEDRPSRTAMVAGFIGAAVLGGISGWELKNTGHSHTKEFHTIINQNSHLKTEVHNMHKTLSHDSRIIGQDHQLLKQDTKTINESHRILKHNRAVLKHLHEQVHHLFKIEKAETARRLSSAGKGGNEARLSYYGDTVWHETARRMHHASAEKIRKATNYVLRLNGLRWNGGGSGVDAHKLPLGFRFRIPRNIVEIASR